MLFQEETLLDVSHSEEIYKSQHEVNIISHPKKIQPSMQNLRKENECKNKRQRKYDVYNKALEALQKDDDEYDHFALAVASKLCKMDQYQRIYCENVINTTICKGMLGQLNENVTIVD